MPAFQIVSSKNQISVPISCSLPFAWLMDRISLSTYSSHYSGKGHGEEENSCRKVEKWARKSERERDSERERERAWK